MAHKFSGLGQKYCWISWVDLEDLDGKRENSRGGISLFADEVSLNAYVQMHTERLKGFGVSTVRAKVFDIPEVLTRIAQGQLTRQHNADNLE